MHEASAFSLRLGTGRVHTIFAEFERAMLRERTRHGLIAARSEGRVARTPTEAQCSTAAGNREAGRVRRTDCGRCCPVVSRASIHRGTPSRPTSAGNIVPDCLRRHRVQAIMSALTHDRSVRCPDPNFFQRVG